MLTLAILSMWIATSLFQKCFSLRCLPKRSRIHLAPLTLSTKPDFNLEIDQKHFDYQRLESQIYSWWESSGYFKPTKPPVDKQKRTFVVPMPPPNVTGYLHMGHAIFIALQDIMIRFNRMKGCETVWIPGTDHAGIATQMLVEKEILKQGVLKDDLGRDEFIRKVWDWKFEKGSYILQQMRRLGASADWSREKFTLDQDMSNAVNEAFLRLHERGLIYRGEYMVNWSPQLRTAVSDLEVEFTEESGTLYYFKYHLADSDDFIPVATTRPETILGDTAVCVNPNDPRYQSFVGKMVHVPLINRMIPVIADEYVDMKFGTGALKVTPAHDHNDYALGKKHGLLSISVMNKDGSINSIGGERYQGLDRFDCRKKIWDDMTKAGLVIKEQPHMQRVPRNQRGGEIIEPMISMQWFLKMDDMAHRAVEAVKTNQLSIIPDRFEKVWFSWLENIHDWCISRQLWWGHQIPVYYIVKPDGTVSSSEYIVARNRDEANAKAMSKFGNNVKLVQDEDVLDTWFSSGLWPFATVGWPQDEDNAESDLQRYYPASVLETGYDILFFWVARMVTLGLELTGKVPFHTIYLHGLVRDANGQKMSKTKGNVIDPIETVESYGCDALRFSLVTGSTPGQDISLSLERIESNRNFVNKLWNLGKFIQAQASPQQEISQVNFEELPFPEKFILNRCDEVISKVSQCLNDLQIGEAGRILHDFLWDDFADWYIEISKSRLRSTDSNLQMQCIAVLQYVWSSSLRLLHPFMPFVTEVLWQLLKSDLVSIIHAPWPEPHYKTNKEANLYFEKLRSLVRKVRNIRSEFNVEASKKLDLVIMSSSTDLEFLSKEAKILSLLCRVEEGITFLRVDEIGPTNAVKIVVDSDLEAYLPEASLVDKEKELMRIGRQIEKLQKDLQVLESRLSNASFRTRAPPILVQEVEGKVGDIRSQLSNLEKSRQSMLV